MGLVGSLGIGGGGAGGRRESVFLLVSVGRGWGWLLSGRVERGGVVDGESGAEGDGRCHCGGWLLSREE
jgi:hypothetical protein